MSILDAVSRKAHVKANVPHTCDFEKTFLSVLKVKQTLFQFRISSNNKYLGEYLKSGVANLSPTMRQLFIIRFQMRHNLHKSWRKYFPPMSRLFTKTKICSRF